MWHVTAQAIASEPVTMKNGMAIWTSDYKVAIYD